jgi:hypothetical protein
VEKRDSQWNFKSVAGIALREQVVVKLAWAQDSPGSGQFGSYITERGRLWEPQFAFDLTK